MLKIVWPCNAKKHCTAYSVNLQCQESFIKSWEILHSWIPAFKRINTLRTIFRCPSERNSENLCSQLSIQVKKRSGQRPKISKGEYLRAFTLKSTITKCAPVVFLCWLISGKCPAFLYSVVAGIVFVWAMLPLFYLYCCLLYWLFSELLLFIGWSHLRWRWTFNL